ncbi:MAG: dihydrofolate reductase [Reichenbachiella sp.]
MANYVYIGTSLDGYIASKDGSLDWLMEFPNPDGSDFGFSAFMDRIDALVMGKNTFEKVLTFGEWPYNKKVFVLSNTLKDIPTEMSDKAEIIQGELQEVVEKLAIRGFKDLYIDGGKVIQSFLRQDLIDEMIITRVPIVLGSGIPLFGELNNPVRFSKVKTETLTDQMVKNYYYK